MKRFVCIHGHFYQPPRENPWLEMIEVQESAYPFHDWNERITSECYGPNAYSRILNDQGSITDIVNNYSKISYNFGPTLLSWMEEHQPEVYLKILEADRLSMEHFSGHGSAMAQCYNHMIMPLASRRDKETQVSWGLADFKHRFGRDAEAIWLPETAVDFETLEVLVDHGIKFTLLAPRQAHMVREIDTESWTDVSGAKIDPRQAYRCFLPSGRHIDLFFYDGRISQAVAFDKLLDDSGRFVDRLLGGFVPTSEYLDGEQAQLVNIATDGESYGHHHRHGDMALAVTLDHLSERKDLKLTNYGEFLELNPPRLEVKIYENSSWSCVHGVERWRKNCGCHTGGKQEWNQEWRAPLRLALDDLSAKLETAFKKTAAELVKDTDKAREEYIEVILERSPEVLASFLSRNMKGEMAKDGGKVNQTKLIRLLEMQRQAMLMYTSCGWFFDEISGIETAQILRYADRAIQLAEQETDIEFREDFLAILKTAKPNVPQYENGADFYNEIVAPSRLTLSKVGMHYAVYSLFEAFPEQLDICNYTAFSETYDRYDAGQQKMAVGRTKVVSRITRSEKHFSFAVVYLGQHQIIGQFDSNMDRDRFDEMHLEIKAAFKSSRIAEVLNVMQHYFRQRTFSFWNLFKDEQRKVLDLIVREDVELAEQTYKKIYDRNYNIMNVMRSADLHIPEVFSSNLELVINTEIKNMFEHGPIIPDRLEKLSERVQRWNVQLNKELLAFVSGDRLLEMLGDCFQSEQPLHALTQVNQTFEALAHLKVQPERWEIQNAFFTHQYDLPFHLESDDIALWEEQMNQLADYLHVARREKITDQPGLPE